MPKEYGEQKITDDRVKDVAPIYANEKLFLYECPDCEQQIFDGHVGGHEGFCTVCEGTVEWERLGIPLGTIFITLTGDKRTIDHSIRAGGFFNE